VAGVELDATIAQVKAAYRQRVLASHPDKNPQAAADGGAKFQRVQAAYATLMSLAEQQQQQAATAQ
jgi:curved DNA-binding protein CbpA